jgi:hypothetical protein
MRRLLIWIHRRELIAHRRRQALVAERARLIGACREHRRQRRVATASL